ncbi:DUF2255 family protein [Fulvitalea axinellae]
MNKEELIEFVNSHKVHQIRAGDKHRFVDITIVESDGRFFVRQYKFGKRSWYDAFLDTPEGEIKYKDIVIPVRGEIPEDLDSINQRITKAYSKKLGLIYHIMRLGFDRKRHEASTLELIPV